VNTVMNLRVPQKAFFFLLDDYRLRKEESASLSRSVGRLVGWLVS
jgi:hypothetical protein